MGTSHRNRLNHDFRDDSPRNAASLACQCRAMIADAVDRGPVVVGLAAFGAGLAIGTMLSIIFAENLTAPQRTVTGTVGRRFMNAISDALPASLRERVQC